MSFTSSPLVPGLAPIAIFAHSRPDHLERLLRSLHKCPEFAATELFVFIDGPRNDADVIEIDKVREVARQFSNDRTEIIEAPENRGLKASIIYGVGKLCASHHRVIVLEDDLEVSAGLLTYFNAALVKYAEHDTIWSVCADVPRLTGISKHEARFLPVGSSWGWATWERAWRRFDPMLELSSDETDTLSFRQRFSVHGLRDFPAMLGQASKRQIDSWYIYWHLAITRHSGLSLFPPHPMTRNGGFFGGTHASRYNLLRFSDAHLKSLGDFDFSLPEDVLIDFAFLDRIIRSSEWRLLRWNSRLGGIKRGMLSFGKNRRGVKRNFL